MFTDKALRREAAKEGISFVELVLRKISNGGEHKSPTTLLAVCPNSRAVIKASLRSAKRCETAIKFATTLNQVDTAGGYTGLTQKQFVKTLRQEANHIGFNGPIIVGLDHGGPWLKDMHRTERWSFDDTMSEIKRSFEMAVSSGYDLLHIDPTIDITLKPGELINIEVVIKRTAELIAHVEKYIKDNNLPLVGYEVGTEEVEGGIADMNIFTLFLSRLKDGLKDIGLSHVWPCFVVGKVGTDLHTNKFDQSVASQIVAEAKKFGSLIKGHYTDNVINPEQYPQIGIGAANVGPEFTECEYDGLLELAQLEQDLYDEEKIPKQSDIQTILRNEVIKSNRWKKWVLQKENPNDFNSISEARQTWLIKTGCRYIWQQPEVISSRSLLYDNLKYNGVDAEGIVLSKIEKAVDKYFYKFNLVNLKTVLG